MQGHTLKLCCGFIKIRPLGMAGSTSQLRGTEMQVNAARPARGRAVQRIGWQETVPVIGDECEYRRHAMGATMVPHRNK